MLNGTHHSFPIPSSRAAAYKCNTELKMMVNNYIGGAMIAPAKGGRNLQSISDGRRGLSNQCCAKTAGSEYEVNVPVRGAIRVVKGGGDFGVKSRVRAKIANFGHTSEAHSVVVLFACRPLGVTKACIVSLNPLSCNPPRLLASKRVDLITNLIN
jgi:hypothetical protein